QTAKRLALPPMTANNEDPKGTAYTVSVDAKEGTTTGISAADRSIAACLLADPATRAEDLTRPGHLFPLIAQDDGVLARDGHTEAGLDFARLAGRSPAAVIAEIVHDDGS
ncbi:3,4-dihydroxy-2-butanone-4-phosphate synthase, partial [Brevibacterium paucivorans]